MLIFCGVVGYHLKLRAIHVQYIGLSQIKF